MVPLIFSFYLVAIVLALYAYRKAAMALTLITIGVTLLFFWHHVTDKIAIQL